MIFLLAISVCTIKNSDTRGYFINLLHDFLGDAKPITKNTLETQQPSAKSRFCLRHVYANFKKNFLGIHIRNLFWAICRASNKVDFQDAVIKVQDVDQTTYKQIIENEPNQWSGFGFDTNVKCDHIINNVSESFNNQLGKERDMPILSLLELYWSRVMTRILDRFKVATKWVTLQSLLVLAKLNKNIESTRNEIILYVDLMKFEVIDYFSKQNIHIGS